MYKKKKHSISVGVHLDSETFEAYARIAERDQRSLSNVLRIALQEQLQKKTRSSGVSMQSQHQDLNG